jgi:hypothetical protein
MKYFIVFVFVVLVSLTGWAQQQPPGLQSLVSVTTTSPEVASLGKFGNTPVSYSTGVPSISVPLYEVKVGAVGFPISLDYHAGGIRVDETSSSVGIGWALQGTCFVSRSKIGLADEGQFGFINSIDPDQTSVLSQEFLDFAYGIAHSGNQSADAEPDIFQYSLHGSSGKFIFKRGGSIMQIPVTNNKIVYANGDFTITDDAGIVYIFDQSTTTFEGEANYTSSWRLTKMVSPNVMDTIRFSYETSCATSIENIQYARYQIGFRGPEPLSGHSRMVSHNDAFLKEISWRGGRISFVNVCDRVDVSGQGMRLDQVKVFSKVGTVEKLVKHIKLYQTNFFSNPYAPTAPTEKNYRLKLDSVSSLPVDGVGQAQTYSMAYNTTAMAPRESYGQDMWGFNNGRFGNTGLLKKQEYIYNGNYYTIGGSDRDCHPDDMLACTITTLRYPTRGKTVFEFEPHQYQTDLPVTTPRSLICEAWGLFRSEEEKFLTVTSDKSAFSMTAFISRFKDTDVTDRPRIIIFDQTANVEVMSISTPVDAVDKDYNTGKQALTLINGHTYRIWARVFTNDEDVKANITIEWVETEPNSIKTVAGGGLRVKSISNYSAAGTLIAKDVYEYGEDGTGVILTPQYYQDINYEYVVYRTGEIKDFGSTHPGTCVYTTDPQYSIIFNANSVYPTSQYSGSPVLYRKVTQRHIDGDGNANGKTVFGFQVFQDNNSTSHQPIPVSTPLPFSERGIFLISNTWKNGFMTSEEVHKSDPSAPSGYTVVQRKTYNYNVMRSDNHKLLKITPVYSHSGCENAPNINDYQIYETTIGTGAMLQESGSEIHFADNTGQLEIDRSLMYEDVRHTYPTKIETSNSKGELLTEIRKYPYDFAATGNVYNQMIARNMVSPVVQTQRLLNGSQTLLETAEFADWFSDSKLLLPRRIVVQVRNNPSEVRVLFNAYDVFGNIIEQQKSNDVLHTYVWDYNSIYPVAEAVNANGGSVAYTSFEAEGKGGFEFTPNVNSTYAVTGRRSHSLSGGTIQKNTGLAAGSKYRLSYWYRSGTAALSGGVATDVTTYENTATGWTYWEGTISGITSFTLEGNGLIDELRCYPLGAQVNTFTYDPLVGMTSRSDFNGTATYFEFDALARLQVIRDQRYNIVKSYQYNYKTGQ